MLLVIPVCALAHTGIRCLSIHRNIALRCALLGAPLGRGKPYGWSRFHSRNLDRPAEHDLLVTGARPDGGVSYVVFVAPERDFVRLRPVFDSMAQSFRAVELQPAQ